MPRNILLITTDQQRYDSLGCTGGTVARTPVIDGLAQDGIAYALARTTGEPLLFKGDDFGRTDIAAA